MMKKLISVLIVLGSFNICQAQNKNVVEIMDDLRLDWDAKVTFLQSFEDLHNICRNRNFHVDLIALLGQIHHHDTTLYQVVATKYSASSDQATLEDIKKLEVDYTTGAFKTFIHNECTEYNFVPYNFGNVGEEFESEKNRVEIELNKYVRSITMQIDIIDEHAHHLNL